MQLQPSARTWGALLQGQPDIAYYGRCVPGNHGDVWCPRSPARLWSSPGSRASRTWGHRLPGDPWPGTTRTRERRKVWGTNSPPPCTPSSARCSGFPVESLHLCFQAGDLDMPFLRGTGEASRSHAFLGQDLAQLFSISHCVSQTGNVSGSPGLVCFLPCVEMCSELRPRGSQSSPGSALRLSNIPPSQEQIGNAVYEPQMAQWVSWASVCGEVGGSASIWS